ncbi:MAG: type IV secretory system conjugative DNA transfer family protein, partial [Rickettsiales bacterium]|nr:type IV secretory system conjugative DNA transfer family protein [Rickettsiales bacterium]
MADKKKPFLSYTGKGKGLGIFNSKKYEPHEQDAMGQMFWRIRWNVFVFILTYVALGAAFCIEHVWRYGWSVATQRWLLVFWHNVVKSYGLSILAETPYWLGRMLFRTDLPTVAPLVALIFYYVLRNDAFETELNPYGTDQYNKGSSKKATIADIRRMKLFDGFIIVLGYFKKKPLKMPETLSALCVAPPGTGKTAGVVVPTIFECAENVSMIINDPKPELKQIASGWCAQKGFVFIMNWAGLDDPARGIFYPSWNPLSSAHVPFQMEQRDLYIDSICSVLIPDKGSTTADPHWTITGRAALSGLTHFII